MREYPPTWFYEHYDAIQQGLPVGSWPSIRAQPLYVRYRYRLVNEALKEAKIYHAGKSGARPVIDVGSL